MFCGKMISLANSRKPSWNAKLLWRGNWDEFWSDLTWEMRERIMLWVYQGRLIDYISLSKHNEKWTHKSTDLNFFLPFNCMKYSILNDISIFGENLYFSDVVENLKYDHTYHQQIVDCCIYKISNDHKKLTPLMQRIEIIFHFITKIGKLKLFKIQKFSIKFVIRSLCSIVDMCILSVN